MNNIIKIEERNPENFSSSLKRVLDIISLKNNTSPVGSFKYKLFKYPGDVDVFEIISENCNKECASHRYVQRFKIMAQRLLLSNPRIYFADFKAGYDIRFHKIYNLLERKNIKSIQKEIESLFNIGAVDKKTYTQMKDIHDYSELIEVVRKFYIIRWNIHELIKEVPTKKLKVYNQRKDIVYTFQEALMSNSTVKIDIWTHIDGKFTEVTNVFVLQYYFQNKKHQLSEYLLNYKYSLANEIISCLKKKLYIKAIKRTWLLSRAVMTNKDKKWYNYSKYLIKKTSGLMSSYILGINQIISEAETIVICIDKKNRGSIPNPPLREICEQILGFSNRVKDFLSWKYKEETFKQIDNIMSNIFKKIDYSKPDIHYLPNKQTFIEFIVIQLFQFQEILTSIVNEESKKWVVKHKFITTKYKNYIKYYSESKNI